MLSCDFYVLEEWPIYGLKVPLTLPLESWHISDWQQKTVLISNFLAQPSLDVILWAGKSIS